MISGKLRILVTGPQGSGKTTQAKLLAESMGLTFIGMGEMLRQMAKEGSVRGQNIKKGLDLGQLVDDDIVAEATRIRLSSNDCKSGFVADGYPRSLDQLKLYDPGFDRVFYLETPDSEVRERLLKRGREDDTTELIKERLKIYHQLTEPLLNYFSKQGIMRRIDGSGTIEEVQTKIREELHG